MHNVNVDKFQEILARNLWFCLSNLVSF